MTLQESRVLVWLVPRVETESGLQLDLWLLRMAQGSLVCFPL